MTTWVGGGWVARAAAEEDVGGGWGAAHGSKDAGDGRRAWGQVQRSNAGGRHTVLVGPTQPP